MLTLTEAGRRLVADVDEYRRTGIAAVLERVTAEQRDAAEQVWRAFAEAGGEGVTGR